jgi:hypothetical protein
MSTCTECRQQHGAADRQREVDPNRPSVDHHDGQKGVNITGDGATATLDAQSELLGRRTVEMKLAREDGWKACMTCTG